MKLHERTRKLLLQFLEYAISGGVWFWTGYLTFILLYDKWKWHWWSAKLLADAIGWTLNYLLQRYWAFKSPTLSRHEVTVTERYLALTAVNFVIDYLIVGGLKAIGVSPNYGLFVSSAFFILWNYLWYRWWVFPRKFENQQK